MEELGASIREFGKQMAPRAHRFEPPARSTFRLMTGWQKQFVFD
jgi:hypothetical protein